MNSNQIVVTIVACCLGITLATGCQTRASDSFGSNDISSVLTRTTAGTRETAVSHYPVPGEYAVRFQSAFYIGPVNSDRPLRDQLLSLTGVVTSVGTDLAWTRRLGWLRIDRVYDEQDAQRTTSREQPVYDPALLNHGARYDNFAFVRRFPAIGVRTGFNRYPMTIHRIEGSLVVYVVAQTKSRVLPLREAYEDNALLRVAPGVHVGVVEYQQTEGRFTATIASWEAKPLTISLGGSKFIPPLVPIGFDWSKELAPERAEGQLRNGWKTTPISLPELIRFDFLDADGKVTHSSDVCGYGLGYETGHFVRTEIDFRVPDGSVVVSVRPLVITQEREIEIPFSITVDDLERFTISSE